MPAHCWVAPGQAAPGRFRQRFDHGFAWLRDTVVGGAADWAVILRQSLFPRGS
jgi:hypothetical protein